MQQITKICERCGKTEHTETSMDNPEPTGEIKRISLTGRGKEIPALKMDLCYACHQFVSHDLVRRLRGQKTLTEFIDDKTESETPEPTE